MGLCVIFPINNLAATIALIICIPFSFLLLRTKKIQIGISAVEIFSLFLMYLLLLTISFIRNESIDGDLTRFIFPILFIPFVFLANKYDKNDFDFFHYVFIAMSAILFVLTFAKLLINASSLNSNSNYIYYINELIWLERPYMGFFLHLGLLSSLFLFDKKNKFLYIIYAIAILLFNILIASKLAVLLNLLAITIFVFRKRTMLGIYFLLFFIGLMVLILNTGLGDGLRNRLHDFSKNEPRVIIWNTASEVYREQGFNKAFGLSNGTYIQGKLDSINLAHRYELVDYYWVYDSHYNTHNQYLYFLLSYGLIGLLLIVLISFYPFILAIIHKDLYSVLVSGSFILFMLVENIYSRQFGVFAFLILTSFIFVQIQHSRRGKEN